MISRLTLVLVLFCLPQLNWSQNFALDFDGIDDRVDIAYDSAYYFGANDFSVEATVKFDVLNNDGAVFTAWTAGSCSQVGWGLLQESNDRMNFYIGDGSSLCMPDQVTSPVLNLGQCYHFAGVKQGSTMRLYMDGVLVDTNTTTKILTDTIPVLIGKRYANQQSVGFHDGTIEELRMWNVARSQPEIQTFMTVPLSGNESSLVGYWPLNDGPGSAIASDLTANGNNGTLVNMDANTDWVSPCSAYTTVPTLSDWGLILFALVLLSIGGIVIWNKVSQKGIAQVK